MLRQQAHTFYIIRFNGKCTFAFYIFVCMAEKDLWALYENSYVHLYKFCVCVLFYFVFLLNAVAGSCAILPSRERRSANTFNVHERRRQIYYHKKNVHAQIMTYSCIFNFVPFRFNHLLR